MRKFPIQLLIAAVLFALVNGTAGWLMGIDLPFWKRIIYNILHQLTGGVIAYIIIRSSIKRMMGEAVQDAMKEKGCGHPGCLAKQKYQLN